MRHRMSATPLGRSTAHRQALLSNLVCQLMAEKRIITTLAKAKAAQRLAEKMVTLAKRGTLAARRRAAAVLRQSGGVKILFAEIGPKCQDRVGGYTRIIKVGQRRGDSALMAILEWVTITPVDKKKKHVPGDEKAKGGGTPK